MALRITDPTLMVLKEKDYPAYFLLRGNEDYFKVLAQIATERVKQGYWYEKKPAKAQTDLFADNSSQHDRIEAILKMDRSTKQFRTEIHHFMQDRMYDGYEYEGWEFERFETIKEQK